FTTGKYYRLAPATLSGGKPGDPPVKEDINSMNPLGGVMAHIYHVKDHADKRSPDDKRAKPTMVRTLYRDFLFYKNFVAGDAPIVVPEGRTDSIYLRCAIRSLKQFHPRLGEIKEGRFQTNIRLMKFSA